MSLCVCVFVCMNTHAQAHGTESLQNTSLAPSGSLQKINTEKPHQKERFDSFSLACNVSIQFCN